MRGNIRVIALAPRFLLNECKMKTIQVSRKRDIQGYQHEEIDGLDTARLIALAASRRNKD